MGPFVSSPFNVTFNWFTSQMHFQPFVPFCLGEVGSSFSVVLRNSGHWPPDAKKHPSWPDMRWNTTFDCVSCWLSSNLNNTEKNILNISNADLVTGLALNGTNSTISYFPRFGGFFEALFTINRILLLGILVAFWWCQMFCSPRHHKIWQHPDSEPYFTNPETSTMICLVPKPLNTCLVWTFFLWSSDRKMSLQNMVKKFSWIDGDIFSQAKKCGQLPACLPQDKWKPNS